MSNIDKIFYDEQGKFIPFGTAHGNISGERAFLRDTFMEYEDEYFKELMTKPQNIDLLINLVESYSSDYLFDYATSLQDKLENGELETKKDLEKMKTMSSEGKDDFHMRKLEEAEAIITLLFAAASDKVKELVLELIMNSREEEPNEMGFSHGRH